MPIVFGKHTGESSAKRYFREQRQPRGPIVCASPSWTLRQQLLTGHVVRAHRGSLEDCQPTLAQAVAALRRSGHERVHDCVALCIPAPGERRVLLPSQEGVQYLLGGIAATRPLRPVLRSGANASPNLRSGTCPYLVTRGAWNTLCCCVPTATCLCILSPSLCRVSLPRIPLCLEETCCCNVPATPTRPPQAW